MSREKEEKLLEYFVADICRFVSEPLCLYKKAGNRYQIDARDGKVSHVYNPHPERKEKIIHGIYTTFC